MNKFTVSTDVPNEIRMTRIFDAPRRLVVQAMTTPELVKRWLGGVRATVVSVEVDLRVGGRYRYAFRAKNGFEFAFVGVYRVIAEDRIVQTESMEGVPGEAEVTTTWVEHDGRTTMTLTMRLPTQAERDKIVATGMSDGAGESYDELEKLLASL